MGVLAAGREGAPLVFVQRGTGASTHQEGTLEGGVSADPDKEGVGWHGEQCPGGRGWGGLLSTHFTLKGYSESLSAFSTPALVVAGGCASVPSQVMLGGKF